MNSNVNCKDTSKIFVDLVQKFMQETFAPTQYIKLVEEYINYSI